LISNQNQLSSIICLVNFFKFSLIFRALTKFTSVQNQEISYLATK
jgi:hypothetical protein